jgi:trk system potassium uptake protein TrkH
VTVGLSVAIALCAIAALVFDVFDPHEGPVKGGSVALGIAAAVTFGLGSGVYLWGRKHVVETVSRREATLAVALIWISAAVCGAIPFVIGARLSPVDALFESVSGLTTTGITILPDIDGTLSRPLMLWRSLLQWLGGMGIVVLFVAVFPNVGAGGKHMFRGEVPGTTAEGLTPRIAETAFTLWKIYAALTALEIVILIALGMSSFDAVCHSFTTMSTGGFSTRDESITYWDSAAIDIVVSIFMIVAGINFGLYYGAIRGLRLRVILSNPEFKVFIGCVVIATSVITIAILPLHEWDLFQAFRYAFFQVGTFITSTGYVTDDYMAYPGWVVAMILMIMFMGGCAGSTAGGMKVERIMLMAKQAWAQVHRFFRPNVVKVVRMGKRPVAEPILADVAAFFMVYIVFTGVATLAMSAADDLPVPTAFGATLSAVSNMGPAPFYQEADNFASYGVTTRLVGVAAMLLGRLEFFTLLALVVPAFWRR